MQWLLDNPVFVKEVKAKLRLRQPVPVLLAIGAMAILVIGWMYVETVSVVLDAGPGNARDFWHLGLVLLGTAIWLVTPGLTANAIAQEREQQTWEMMLFTRLTVWQIVLGKLAARTLPVIAVGILSLPPMLFCARTAGVPPLEVLLTYGTLTLWSAMLLTVGLFCSWSCKRTATAVSVAYVYVIGVTIGLPMLTSAIAALTGGWYSDDAYPMWVNPVRVGQALARPGDATNAGVIVLSTVVYAALTALLLAVMGVRLRKVAA